MNAHSAILAAVRALQSHGVVVRAVGISAMARRGGGGHLAVSVADASRTYAIAVRDRVTPAMATALDAASDQPVLVIAPYIGDEAADVLRARGIDYADTAGNAHLAWDGVLIDVRGRRRVASAPRRRSPAASRAFTRSGAQVVFVLLSWPEVAARPLREIARVSGVSLGTAQIVIDDLTSAGYLYEGPGGRTLARGGELLNHWAESYALWLAPKLRLATFAADDPRWWEGAEAELADAGVQLGGELAAEPPRRSPPPDHSDAVRRGDPRGAHRAASNAARRGAWHGVRPAPVLEPARRRRPARARAPDLRGSGGFGRPQTARACRPTQGAR